MTLDEADLLALKERTKDGPDSHEIAAAVDELLALRKDHRNAARRDIMMMAAAIASEFAHNYKLEIAESRDYIARHSVMLAFEIEKVTPR